jgi:hypothetical protein
MAAPACGLLLVSGAAGAQRPISLGIAGGVTMPRDRLESVTERGYHGLATLRLGVPLVPVHLRLDAMHGRFGPVATATRGLQVSALTANLGYDVIPLSFAALYALGGAGWYWSEWDAPGAESIREVGWNAGAGLRLSIGSVRLFGEARYHSVPTTEGTVHFVPLTFGVLF